MLGPRHPAGVSKQSKELRLLIIFLLFIVAPISLLFADGACTTSAQCNGHGSCLTAAAACRCDVGWLGAQCDIGSTLDMPVHAVSIEGREGQQLLQEWQLNATQSIPAAQRSVRIRWTVNIVTWFGAILEVGWDGMT